MESHNFVFVQPLVYLKNRTEVDKRLAK